MPDHADLGGGVLHVTVAAARRVSNLAAKENRPDALLRLTVMGGGCAGFRYGFAFDESIEDDDVVFENAGARVVTDHASLELLNGATLDYVEDLAGSAFQILNPNAQSSCGCGNSFSA